MMLTTMTSAFRLNRLLIDRLIEVWERDELPIDLRLERPRSGRVLVWAVYEQQQYRCCFEMLLKEVYNNKNKRRNV